MLNTNTIQIYNNTIMLHLLQPFLTWYLIFLTVVFYVFYFISGVAHDLSTPAVDTNVTFKPLESSRFVNQEQQPSSRRISKDSLPTPVVCELNLIHFKFRNLIQCRY